MKYFFGIIFFLLTRLSWAQELSIDQLEVSNEGVVSFTCSVIQHHSSREEYSLFIYTSVDDFNEPLNVEVGTLRPGQLTTVSFDGNEIIGDFDGNIEFDFRLKAVTFPVEVMLEKRKFKKGKKINVRWTDFHESGWYDLELYQNGESVHRLIGNHRGTYYSGKLPKDIKSGEYELRVTPSNEKTLHSEQMSVKVTSKGKGLVIGAGSILAGSGVFYLISNGNKEDDLPTPPGVPGD
ncbi:MAG: hypothetical protein ABJ004_10240 [Cyclobacteriaceae bacterium]